MTAVGDEEAEDFGRCGDEGVGFEAVHDAVADGELPHAPGPVAAEACESAFDADEGAPCEPALKDDLADAVGVRDGGAECDGGPEG